VKPGNGRRRDEDTAVAVSGSRDWKAELWRRAEETKERRESEWSMRRGDQRLKVVRPYPFFSFLF
jgi:hypothetical protein